MNDESTPKGAHEIPAKVSNVSLPEPTHAGTDDTVPTLEVMTPRARAIALAYFESGRVEGIAAGRQLEVDEQRGRGAVSAAIAAQQARLGSFADLCEARGEIDRAARSRQILADRGIS